jgi:hypothetical protein
VGDGGTILHYNGSWSAASSPTGATLWDIWGSSASDIWAVGASTVVIRYNGSTWSNAGPIPVLEGKLRAVSGRSASDVWIISGQHDTQTSWPVVAQYNGSSWIDRSPTGTYAMFRGGWVSQAGEVFAVGTSDPFVSNYLLYYDGSSWTDVTPGSAPALNAAWGFGSCDVWVVGDSGATYHLAQP